MSDRLEDKLRTVLMGYEFSVDNLREGEHFNFSTLSPAMLDSIVENLKQATQSYIDSKVTEELMQLGELNLYNQPTGYKANKKLNIHIEKRLAELKLKGEK